MREHNSLNSLRIILYKPTFSLMNLQFIKGRAEPSVELFDLAQLIIKIGPLGFIVHGDLVSLATEIFNAIFTAIFLQTPDKFANLKEHLSEFKN